VRGAYACRPLPALFEQLPKTNFLLTRPLKRRVSTTKLIGRTTKVSERSLRLDASVEALCEINVVKKERKDDTAALLLALADHLDCKAQLMSQLGMCEYFSPRKMHELRFLLKLKKTRMLPMMRRMKRDGQAVCEPDAYETFIKQLPIAAPQIVSVAAMNCDCPIAKVRHP
jgi:hypothetical protein